MSEQETLEHQSHELVEGLVKDWVRTAADTARGSADKISAHDAIHRMQWLYLAEPWLITSKIFDALKLAGWAAPEGSIEVDYTRPQP